jgi:hypothetical protein
MNATDYKLQADINDLMRIAFSEMRYSIDSSKPDDVVPAAERLRANIETLMIQYGEYLRLTPEQRKEVDQ